MVAGVIVGSVRRIERPAQGVRQEVLREHESKYPASNDVTVVDLSGQIKLGEGSSVLRDTVKDLLGKGQKKILLNLGNINYIDSSGIGELVSAFTSVRNQGGELKLPHLTKKVHDLLQITKLCMVFHVMDDEAGAIAAFSS
jgi:anti-sigma B factor antagonist